MNNEVKLKGLAGLAHLLSPGADWAYDDAARNVRDYVKEQTLALAAKDRDLADAKHMLILANNNAAAFQRVAEQRQGEIERLERGLEWCLENGAKRTDEDGIHRVCTISGWPVKLEIPADLTDIIIKPTTGASNG